MTNTEALEQAQLRVDSYKGSCMGYDSWEGNSFLDIDRAQRVATIAIETEINDFNDCETVSKIYCATVFKKLIDLQQIKEQINNTI